MADTSEDIEKEQVDETASLMVQPFDPTKIKVETKTPSLDTLIKRIANETVQLNTESYFQRKDDLWDGTKQSRLIESILIQFPLPAFFFDATDENNWLVVDGLQRLSSIRNFVVNKTLKLSNLEFLTHLDGKGWIDLPPALQTNIEETQVVIYKILPGTPTDVKFNIFKRINTGGLVLEPQEIRHALFQGKPSKFIYELAKTKEFLKATNNKIQTNRMLDRDFVNRFLCFYLFGVENYGTKDYGQDLDSFMSKAMASIYEKSETKLQKIKLDFENSMKLSHEIFGYDAFRKVLENHNKSPINKSLFEVISVQFALLTESQQSTLLVKKSEMKNAVNNAFKQDDFIKSISTSTGDKNRILFRHNKIKELIYSVIGK